MDDNKDAICWYIESNYNGYNQCNICGCEFSSNKVNYCPQCGVKFIGHKRKFF